MATRVPLREAVTVYVAVTLATFAITRFEGAPAVRDFVQLAVATLFLLTAFLMAQRDEGGVRRFGLDLGGLLLPASDDRPAGPLGLIDLGRALLEALPSAARETVVALGVAAVVFPPFTLAFYLWHRPSAPFHLDLSSAVLATLFAELVVVALPEEALFRGYFQTRLADAWPTRVRLLGTEVSPAALVGQAALFGAMHFVVDWDPRRLAVFFPALLFGWLRAWRKGVGAAIVLHAVSNVYIGILIQGWL